MNQSCKAEFDTHADTCGINNVASHTRKMAHSSPFTPELEKIENVPIVRATITYNDSINGETYVIIVNQALYFYTALPHILLNHNQMQAMDFKFMMYPITCPRGHQAIQSSLKIKI
jgi:hypothetical protein